VVAVIAIGAGGNTVGGSGDAGMGCGRPPSRAADSGRFDDDKSDDDASAPTLDSEGSADMASGRGADDAESVGTAGDDDDDDESRNAVSEADRADEDDGMFRCAANTAATSTELRGTSGGSCDNASAACSSRVDETAVDDGAASTPGSSNAGNEALASLTGIAETCSSLPLPEPERSTPEEANVISVE
jgi:hypothetical protein